MLFERIKLESEEKILRVVRKHWWIIFVRLFLITLTALFPLIILVVLPVFSSSLNASVSLGEHWQALTALYLFWLLGCWITVGSTVTDYYLDLWAISDRRIVAIEQNGFFKRRLSSFRLERLQDMNITVKGLIPTLLNFGTIEAQTAGGSNEEFKTDNMPDPRGLKALIIHAADVRQREAGIVNQLNQEGL